MRIACSLCKPLLKVFDLHRCIETIWLCFPVGIPITFLTFFAPRSIARDTSVQGLIYNFVSSAHPGCFCPILSLTVCLKTLLIILIRRVICCERKMSGNSVHHTSTLFFDEVEIPATGISDVRCICTPAALKQAQYPMQRWQNYTSFWSRAIWNIFNCKVLFKDTHYVSYAW